MATNPSQRSIAISRRIPEATFKDALYYITFPQFQHRYFPSSIIYYIEVEKSYATTFNSLLRVLMFYIWYEPNTRFQTTIIWSSFVQPPTSVLTFRKRYEYLFALYAIQRIRFLYIDS